MVTEFYRGWYCNIAYSSLTNDEILHNGKRLGQNLYNLGWYINPICAILGNVHVESNVNPGAINGGSWTTLPTNAEVLATSFPGAMGFTQWKPGREKIVQFAEDNGRVWYDGMNQVFRLKWEWENHEQMGGWDWFVHNDHTPLDDLTEFFCRQYERPTPEAIEQSLPERKARARYWFGILDGNLFDPRMLWYNRKRRKEGKPQCLRI